MDDSLDAYDFDIYQVSPGADEHLIVQFDSVDPLDAGEMYVRAGAVPDWTDPAKYDAAGKVLVHADQFAEVTETEDDTYFVLVRSTYDFFNGADAYSLRADTLDTLPHLEIGVEIRNRILSSGKQKSALCRFIRLNLQLVGNLHSR